MEEKLRVGERGFSVAAREPEPDRLTVFVNGAPVEIALLDRQAGAHLVQVNGLIETIYTARSAEGVFVWHRGRARLVQVAPRERPVGPTAAPSRASRLPPGSVGPPTPAVVVALLVEVGQAVSKGQPVAVVSAMKMQSQLTAPCAGRVKAVNVRIGAKVRADEALVEIEPEGS